MRGVNYGYIGTTLVLVVAAVAPLSRLWQAVEVGTLRLCGWEMSYVGMLVLPSYGLRERGPENGLGGWANGKCKGVNYGDSL